MYKIHFENRFLALCRTRDEAFADQNGITSHIEDASEIENVVNYFQSNHTLQHYYIICDNYEEAISKIESLFTNATCGGGMVHNPDGEILMIFRRGKWDLPKGHQEEGETIEECALREVEEETGLSNLSIENPLCVTRHTYLLNGETILKHTYWFEMATSDNSLVPQTEEDITSAEWLSPDKICEALQNTFDSIKEVFAATSDPATTSD